MESNELIAKLEEKENPSVKATLLSRYISIALRTDEMTLFEAYNLYKEVIKFTRQSYTEPAWNESVRITTCLQMLNMKMMAYLFSEPKSVGLFDMFAKESYKLNTEKRQHYIMEHYYNYLDFVNNVGELNKLSEIRKSKIKSFDRGPYHTEVFPYEYCSPEELILSSNLLNDKIMREEIENLIIFLNI